MLKTFVSKTVIGECTFFYNKLDVFSSLRKVKFILRSSIVFTRIFRGFLRVPLDSFKYVLRLQQLKKHVYAHGMFVKPSLCEKNILIRGSATNYLVSQVLFRFNVSPRKKQTYLRPPRSR